MTRRAVVVPLVLTLLASGLPKQERLPIAAPNDNRVPAGSLRDGELEIALEAKLAMWHPDGDSLPGLAVESFAERGKQPSAPGPLLRVPAGTELRVSVRNALTRDTITFYVPAKTAGVNPTPNDSVVVLPGETRELRARVTIPGNYVYRANGRTALDRVLRMRGFLAGALIVDSAGRTPRNDRVFVLLDAVDSLSSIGVPNTRREILAINGRSWPHTERITATLGDTLRWRVLNGSGSVHPMHLHGFYYRIDGFDGPGMSPAQVVPGRMVATERMTPFTTMSMSWAPDRSGNWLFHCHYQPHATPHRPLGPPRLAAHHDDANGNHAFTAMGGLVMAVHVNPRGPEARTEPTQRVRQLRLVAARDAGFPDSLPSMRFTLEERSTGRRSEARSGFSPTIELMRGQPVAITVVNRLTEPTSVHWHGIELESFHDGVAGFSGSGRRLAPLITPGDSFVARFTPPRSGTFIYHSHVDEPRQHRAGLGGALIVRDGPPSDSVREHLFFIKSARGSSAEAPMEINGQVNPDTIVLRAGRRYALRFIGLTVTSPNATVYLTARPDSSLANLRDTLLVRWRPLAKDGADLPERDRTLRLAQQAVSIGETYDFEFVPLQRGQLRLEVRPPSQGRLTVRVPLRVE
jgi:FtsP/CotA-like multicopper oxidase with cupredoxin domain